MCDGSMRKKHQKGSFCGPAVITPFCVSPDTKRELSPLPWKPPSLTVHWVSKARNTVLWMNHFCADIMQDAAFNILRPLFFWAFIFVFVSIFIIEKTNTFCNLTSSYVSSSQTSPDPKDWATWVTIKGPLGGRNLIIQKVLKPKKSITSPHLEEGEQLP